MSRKPRFETLSIHAGLEPDPTTGAVVTPIYQTSTFVQDGVGNHKGYEYARTQNPTRNALESAISSLEGGAFGFAFGSGMAAVDAVLRVLNPGDHVLAMNDLYGGTFRLFDKHYRKYGIKFGYASADDTDEFVGQISRSTALIWLETPTNPLLALCDIAEVARRCRQLPSSPLICVDNTFATPYIQRPLELGADVVVHSTTKYLGGHSDLVGGVVVVNHENLAEHFGFIQNAAGAIPGPLDCFLTLRGLQTLAIRMERHAENAFRIAEFLQAHSLVDQVHYPFLSSHPQYSLAKEQMLNGGGMVSFIHSGGSSAAVGFAESTTYFLLAESLGGVESLIEIPALMTHASTVNSPLELNPALIRLSVGLENVDDLIEDLEGAFRG